MIYPKLTEVILLIAYSLDHIRQLLQFPPIYPLPLSFPLKGILIKKNLMHGLIGKRLSLRWILPLNIPLPIFVFRTQRGHKYSKTYVWSVTFRTEDYTAGFTPLSVFQSHRGHQHAKTLELSLTCRIEDSTTGFLFILCRK